MKLIKEFFSEKGDMSMMRLISFMSGVAAIIIAIVGISKPQPDYTGISVLVTAFLTAAVGGKVMQKRYEVDDNSNDSSN